MLSLTEVRGHLAVHGLLATVLGVVFMVWPSITIGTVVALFAIVSFSDALVSGVRAFAKDIPTRDRVMHGLRALLEVTAAVVAITYPGPTAAAMTVLIGIYAIVTGGFEIAARSLLSGVLSILVGATLVVWPGIGAVTLALVFGAYLTVSGVLLLISAAKVSRAVPAGVRA